MAQRRKLGDRWMALARAAARGQANVLLWVMYTVLWVPLGAVRRLFTDPLARRSEAGWRERQPTPRDLDSARRQF